MSSSQVNDINNRIFEVNSYISQFGSINHVDPDTQSTLLHQFCDEITTIPIEAFKYLTTKGPDINALDQFDYTPIGTALMSCSNNQDCQKVMYLLEYYQHTLKNNQDELLHVAAGNINFVNIDIFQFLVEKLKLNICSQSRFQLTPLHIALSNIRPNGDINIVTYLLSKCHNSYPNNESNQHNNINLQDDEHVGSILHRSCKNIRHLPLSIYTHLIEVLHVDVFTHDCDKMTPLDLALQQFRPDVDLDILRYLLLQYGIVIDDITDSRVAFSTFNPLFVDKLSLTEFCVEMNYIKDPNRYLMWLCSAYNPRYDAVKYVEDQCMIDYWYNADQKNEPSELNEQTKSNRTKNIGHYLHKLVSQRSFPFINALSREEVFKSKEKFDDKTSIIVEYHIGKCVERLLLTGGV
jgi:ankyrin repeat protein